MYQRIRSRPFTWDDVGRLHELVARRWAVDGPRSQMHIGDFYWILRTTPEDDPLRLLRVWPRQDGSLTAFALLDPPDQGDVIVAPGAEASMLDEALDWLKEEHHTVGGGAFSIVLLDGDRPRAETLRRRGYAPGDGGNMRFWQALESAPASALLQGGFSLRNVATEKDVERRVFVQTTSFESFSITAGAWRSLTGRLPGYRPELDLIAVSPDGSGASACTCWYDSVTRCGEFEAVGTSKAFQRMGVRKAVIMEGLRRLHELGATQAVVQTTIANEPAIALYGSCGFQTVAADRMWVIPHD